MLPTHNLFINKTLKLRFDPVKSAMLPKPILQKPIAIPPKAKSKNPNPNIQKPTILPIVPILPKSNLPGLSLVGLVLAAVGSSGVGVGSSGVGVGSSGVGVGSSGVGVGSNGVGVVLCILVFQG